MWKPGYVRYSSRVDCSRWRTSSCLEQDLFCLDSLAHTRTTLNRHARDRYMIFVVDTSTWKRRTIAAYVQLR